jgi:hypothetical protein
MLDNRSPRNPFDISKRSIYNPYNVQRIEETIKRYFLPMGDKCKYCKFELEDPLPTCILDCPWRVHWTPGNRYPKGHPMIESKRPNPFSIFIKKTNLLFCYYNKLDFIFLGSVLHGMEIDHINSDPFDDREENLVPILSQGPNLIKGKEYKALQKRFKEIWEIKNQGVKHFTPEIETELRDIINKLNKYSDKIIPERFYHLIIHMQNSINQNKIFVPPKSWWVHYNSSELLDHVEKKLKEEPEKYYHPEEKEEENDRQ